MVKQNVIKNNFKSIKMKSIKLISSFLLGGLFIFLAVASGEETNENEVVWESNKKECFCGKKFTSTNTIDAIDMTTKVVTILNCDGTYVSKEDWGTSEANEETYNNTVGRSSGNNSDFSGTWQIVDKNIPSKIVQFFIEGKFVTGSYTIIKYKSNNGRERFAYIQYDKSLDTELYLGTVTFEDENLSEDDLLDLHTGLAYY